MAGPVSMDPGAIMAQGRSTVRGHMDLAAGIVAGTGDAI